MSNTPFNEVHGAISPDNQWVAYASDETGRYEVYVQEFPKAAQHIPVSTRGGSHPRWTQGGRELIYLQSDGILMSVAIRDAGAAGVPRPLFKTRVSTAVNPSRFGYVPTRDGQTFLLSVPVSEPDPGAITVVINWPPLLKR